MALMVVKVENEASLMMNEFFDYNGTCWAVSRLRGDRKAECANLEDFYECTVRTEWLEDVPVVFILDNQVIGWYKSAKIYRNLQVVSAFLEGNICARTLDVRLLAQDSRIKCDAFEFKEKMYQVIEEDDERFGKLKAILKNEQQHLVQIRFDMVQSFYSGDRVRLAGSAGNVSASRGTGSAGNSSAPRGTGSAGNSSAPRESGSTGNLSHYRKMSGFGRQSGHDSVKAMRDYCIEKCGEIAQKVMNDQCLDIRELKTMYQYANQAVTFDKDCVDGWYYFAMACEQLGFIKDGFKAVERALKMEPDADDLLALKGHLLFASGKYEDAAAKYQEAFDIHPMDGYLMCVGQAWFAMGNVDKAYKAYQQVSDKKILEDYGINLKDMERKWPFVALRGFSIKDLFGKKH